MFDEPTVGLDPEERVRFRNLIADLANDCIIILSSHIVSDFDTIADKIAILKEGKLIEYGNQTSIINKVTDKVFETFIDSSQLDTFKNNHIIVSTFKMRRQIKSL